MSLRRGGADVEVDRASLAAAYPAAGPDLVVFLPGLCEDETAWDRRADRYGTTYPEALAAAGWSPLMVRANTGLAVQDNGALLAALLADVVDAWPVEVARVALVGHSMGGLVARVACALDAAGPVRWSPLVTDVVTLGTPHLGAPLAGWARSGSAGLARFPETSAFGRIIDQRSVGILDLERGLDLDAAPALPHAQMRLVSGSLGRPGAPGGAGDVGARRPPGPPGLRHRRRKAVSRRRSAARGRRRPLRPPQSSRRTASAPGLAGPGRDPRPEERFPSVRGSESDVGERRANRT